MALKGIVAWLQKKVMVNKEKFVGLFIVRSLLFYVILMPTKRIWLAAVTCGILRIKQAQVVWLSDNKVGFWRLYDAYLLIMQQQYLAFTMLVKTLK